jgi:hypothetical protein
MLKESPARSYLASLQEISGLDPDHEFARPHVTAIPLFPETLALGSMSSNISLQFLLIGGLVESPVLDSYSSQV